MELVDLYTLDGDTDRILVTSALPYVNNVPHLGNMVPLISADVYTRYLKMKGLKAAYICASDEHGTRTETEAARQGIDEETYCRRIHDRMEEVFRWFHVDFDYFGRTSIPENHELTQQLFLAADANGYIEEQEIEQLYSVEEDKYLPDTFVIGTCPHCGYHEANGDQCDDCGRFLDPHELISPRSKTMPSATLESRRTRHLYLKLDALAPATKAWIESMDHWSGSIRNIPLAWIEGGMHARGITRDLKWGIQVPKDGFRDKVFYVWFDAPIGYIASTWAWCKETGQELDDWWKGGKSHLLHFLGKDNVPFHTLMWPGTLIAADQDWNLPTYISSNEYLTYEGKAFSKSRGIGVFSEDAMALDFPADAWRFYIVSNRPEQRDVDFDFKSFQNVVSTALVDNIGNLVNRTLSFTAKRIGAIPPEGTLTVLDQSTLAEANAKVAEIEDAYKNCKLRLAARLILELGDIGNRYFQESEPWATFKSDRPRCETTLHVACRLVYQLAQLAWPLMPERCGLILKTLGGAFDQSFPGPGPLDAPPLLFQKIDDAKIEALIAQFGDKKEDDGVLAFTKEPEVTWPCVILSFDDLTIKRRIKPLRRKIKEEVGKLDLDALEQLEHVQAYQELMEKFDRGGKHSVQNLIDIVRREGKLPNINALVDIYNLYSLREGIIMGAYDRTSIKGTLIYGQTDGTERFYPVKGGAPASIDSGEWVLKDETGQVVTRVASKQAEAVAISTNTTSCAMCIQGNPLVPVERLQEIAEAMAAEVVERCGGTWKLVHAG